MKAYDFEYDNKNLSDFGMIICSFGSKGLETLSNGSQITFNTIPTLSGSKHKLVSTEYEECLETTIQICKTPCNSNAMEISPNEFRELTKWLSRKRFLKFKILDDYHWDLWFEASFNVSRIEFNGEIYGLELEVKTNRPYALKDPQTIKITNDKKSRYMWEQYEYSKNGEFVYTKLDNRIIAETDENGEWKYIEYSDSMRKNELSLSSPITRIETPTKENINGVIQGKYIYASMYEDNEERSGYYYIPSGATIGFNYDGLKKKHYVQPSTMDEITIKPSSGNFIKHVYSDNSDTYPTNGLKDGYWYVYVGDGYTPHSIRDISHEEGYIYPHIEITIGNIDNLPDNQRNLSIYNDIEDRNTYIANCKSGEIITMDYPVIESSNKSHDISNDFNWNFFRIANTFDERGNDISISLPCTVKIIYSPIVKVGL